MNQRWKAGGEAGGATPRERNGGYGLSHRAREIRMEMYGEDGVGILAGAVGVPTGTWLNFEAGVAMPAEFVLRFLDATGVSPRWLLDGRGDRYAGGRYDLGSSRTN